MQALILAGGRGTRLKPYTTVIPKPLMPVAEYPIIEIILRQLKHAGVTEVILAVGYLAQLFQAFFQDGSRHGVRITYSIEQSPLGTAGPIALALDHIEDDFLVMNGDILTTLSYKNLFSYHRSMKAAATIGLYKREVKIDFGVIECGPDGRLARYKEKPVYHFDVSMGINVINKKAVAPYFRPGEPLDIPELMMRLVRDGLPVHCFQEPCYWLDIGRMDDYQTAIETFDAKRSEFLPEAT